MTHFPNTMTERQTVMGGFSAFLFPNIVAPCHRYTQLRRQRPWSFRQQDQTFTGCEWEFSHSLSSYRYSVSDDKPMPSPGFWKQLPVVFLEPVYGEWPVNAARAGQERGAPGQVGYSSLRLRGYGRSKALAQHLGRPSLWAATGRSSLKFTPHFSRRCHAQSLKPGAH